jgi:hypothetical protein
MRERKKQIGCKKKKWDNETEAYLRAIDGELQRQHHIGAIVLPH